MKQVVLQAQRLLLALGYFGRAADLIMGLKIERATRFFQKTFNRDDTGKVCAQLIDYLRRLAKARGVVM
jgi:hypothetical protein